MFRLEPQAARSVLRTRRREIRVKTLPRLYTEEAVERDIIGNLLALN
jgi:hypothetical protein